MKASQLFVYPYIFWYHLFAIKNLLCKGFAAGPLLWAPLSEMYGRATIFNLTNVFFVAFTLGCGFANDLTSLIILRFFAGFNGSACLALGGGVIADMIAPNARGKATALWSIGPLMGPVCLLDPL
jgi:MFS family permease